MLNLMVAFPKALGRRYGALRRDLEVLLNGLRGRNPAPLVDRPPRQRETGSAGSARRVRVVEVLRHTEHAMSVVLEDPAGRPIEFLPGQFFTVLASVDGKTVRRAYSASSCHLDNSRMRLTIKRVDGGQVSNFLNDSAQPGQILRVLGPSGEFICPPLVDVQRHVVLVGGGSGITPLMSITQGILRGEPQSTVSLLFCNRSEADVIFRDELEELARAHEGRFRLRHVYGMLEPQALQAFLDDDGRPAAGYYVCGPEGLMTLARQTLLERGVAPEDIREERFSSPHLRQGSNIVRSAQPLVIHHAGRSHAVLANPGESILDAGLRAGVPMKFSCAMGGCGACKVKISSGAADMEEPNCLGNTERESGYVLACVSCATEPTTVEV